MTLVRLGGGDQPGVVQNFWPKNGKKIGIRREAAKNADFLNFWSQMVHFWGRSARTPGFRWSKNFRGRPSGVAHDPWSGGGGGPATSHGLSKICWLKNEKTIRCEVAKNAIFLVFGAKWLILWPLWGEIRRIRICRILFRRKYILS